MLIAGKIALVLIVCLLLGSCSGAYIGIGRNSYDDYWYDDVYLRNGDRRGDYIYYHGDWHYLGLGTPFSYVWDPYFF